MNWEIATQSKICLKTEIVILHILVLNLQKKVSDYVSKSYYF